MALRAPTADRPASVPRPSSGAEDARALGPGLLTRVEELLALAHSQTRSGRARRGRLRYGIAAAVLMDLVHSGRISCADDDVVVTDSRPTGIDFLDGVLRAMSADAGVHEVRYWLQRLGEDSDALERRVIEGLVEAGVLRREEHRRVGLLRSPRYAAADPGVRMELVRRLLDTLREEGIPSPADVSLLALADDAGLLPTLLSERALSRLSARADLLRQLDPIAEALREMRRDRAIAVARALVHPCARAA